MSDNINILGIDTSFIGCSVALMQDNNLSCKVGTQEQRSQNLLSMIQEVLLNANLHLNDLTMLAFAAGPGSFTGLKVASCIIQALQLVNNTPIIKVSTLQALALQAYKKFKVKTIMPCIDAKMGQLYYGLYNFEDNNMIPTIIMQDDRSEPRLISIKYNHLIEKDVLIVGDGATILKKNHNLSSITANLHFIPDLEYSTLALNVVMLASHYYKKYGIISDDANPIYLNSSYLD